MKNDERERESDMSETDFRQLLEQVLFESEDMVDANVRSFEAAGVMTLNEGLVVRVDGAEFQLTVVRSR